MTSIQSPAAPLTGVCQAVASSPSTAAAARERRSPARRAPDVAVNPPCAADGRPTSSSTRSSDSWAARRALPYGVKVRATGPSTQRAMLRSSSSTTTSAGLAERRLNT